MKVAIMTWLIAIIVGGIAGWLAGQFMKVNTGVLINIILGVVGSLLANFLLGIFGIAITGGWLAYLISGFIGASLLIFISKKIKN
ncbi:GlsB/YeaQ/YmgE family stress response membrane protein [Lentilitoribacter sp. Alg239-R112]|uniref:GlsB/YeaQ/YmgE family stress response membrane protein n=1 Tax=Lentilitoribacter sp. Alg239-R112 TaxID=2305987 RepID=UPI0013A6A954|nr:GlsB/YeaQ/YmgE family stress response membrane protein [Lentilitoribacter sp. Alg239-R112]